MLSLFDRSDLKDLIEKVEQGERLGYEEGIRLLKSKDILALGYMANLIRERKNGDRTYFAVNRIDYKEIYEEVTLGSLDNEGQVNLRMLYGHEETVEERIKQLLDIREIQDRTGRLLSFAPLPFHPKSMPIEGTMGVESTTGFEDLRMLSVSRILLDNINHIKTYWLTLGPKLAQVSLSFGVDDLDGTVLEEKSKQSIGEMKEQAMSKRVLIKLIHKARRQALERDTLYHVLTDYGWEGGVQK